VFHATLAGGRRRAGEILGAAVAIGALLGCACSSGGAGGTPTSSSAPPAASSPTTFDHGSTGPARVATVPPIEATLHDEAWKLTVRLDTTSPSASLEIRGARYALQGTALELLSEELAGSSPRDGGTRPAHAALRYRLRFQVDECEHEPPTPDGRWPGLCGHREGEPRPQHLAPYELLVDVDSSYWATGELHRLAAACVPHGGAGPACKLDGTLSKLDP
jgi:hypothetical protein